MFWNRTKSERAFCLDIYVVKGSIQQIGISLLQAISGNGNITIKLLFAYCLFVAKLSFKNGL